MKSMKGILRIWITTASVAGFMGGWALLAHAEKPAPIENKPSVSAQAPLPTLQPLQPLKSNNFNNSSNLQQFSVQPQQQRSFFPRLRTGGS
ncbi:MAG: hypothetical protein P8074_23555 [Anaerolineales bacterium]|jgi:hypothetical protein